MNKTAVVKAYRAGYLQRLQQLEKQADLWTGAPGLLTAPFAGGLRAAELDSALKLLGKQEEDRTWALRYPMLSYLASFGFWPQVSMSKKLKQLAKEDPEAALALTRNLRRVEDMRDRKKLPVEEKKRDFNPEDIELPGGTISKVLRSPFTGSLEGSRARGINKILSLEESGNKKIPWTVAKPYLAPTATKIVLKRGLLAATGSPLGGLTAFPISVYQSARANILLKELQRKIRAKRKGQQEKKKDEE